MTDVHRIELEPDEYEALLKALRDQFGQRLPAPGSSPSSRMVRKVWDQR